MSKVMALPGEYRDLFEKKHGIKLGFMGFFVKACVRLEGSRRSMARSTAPTRLQEYYHVGVAVGTDAPGRR